MTKLTPAAVINSRFQMAGTSLIVEEQLTTFHEYYLAKKNCFSLLA
jgi:hypothetical protein